MVLNITITIRADSKTKDNLAVLIVEIIETDLIQQNQMFSEPFHRSNYCMFPVATSCSVLFNVVRKCSETATSCKSLLWVTQTWCKAVDQCIAGSCDIAFIN